MKGQILVFEQVLLFSLGVAIFIASFALFVMYHTHYLAITAEDQIAGVKEYITSNIINLVGKGDFNSSVILKIPRRINNQNYYISLDNGVKVTLYDGTYDFSDLSTLSESFEFEGENVLSDGEIVIYKIGNKIILR
jgi:hypothetical protein